MREPVIFAAQNGEIGMPQSTIRHYKKYLAVLNGHIKKIEALTRASQEGRKTAAPGLIRHFSELYHMAGFLNLMTIARLAYLGGQLVSKRSTGSRGLSRTDKSLLLTLLKQIRRLRDDISLADEFGAFVTPSRKIIYPAVENVNTKAIEWITGLFGRAGIVLPERFPIRPVTMNRSEGGQLDFTIPDPVLRMAGRGEYIAISYLDLAGLEDPLDLISHLRNWKNEGQLLYHGALEFPTEEEEVPPLLPYYLIMKTKESPEEFWKGQKQSVRLLSVLSGPDQTISLVSQAEPPEKVITYEPDSETLLEEDTILFDPSSSLSLDELKLEPSRLEKASLPAEGNEALQEEEEQEEQEKRKRPEPGTLIRYPIGVKMSFITSIIIIIALTGMIVLATFFFLQDSQVRVEESNLKLSETIASQAEETLLQLGNSASLLLLGAGYGDTPEEVNYMNYYFRSEQNILMVGIPGEDRIFFNSNLMGDLGISEEFILGIMENYPEQIRLAQGGTPSVFNVSIHFGIPMLGMTIPYKQERGIKTLFIFTDIRQTLQKAVQSRGITDTFIVDSDGYLIAHPDATVVTSGINMGDLPIVQELFSSAVNTGQIRFEEEEDVFYLGSYKKVNFGRLGVITTVPEKLAFEAIYKIQRRNILLMVMFVALAILIVYYYSKSLSNPIRKLVKATVQIEEGDYNLQLKPRSQDEIGVLTRAFVNMGMGLEEKERIKDAFGRFVNKEMAEMAEKGEIQLGGEIKPATIFFSDIRSFTAISEKLTPSEVVSFLNEYMTLMVDCVNDTNGVVDKYIGDAIMAVWGTPISHGNDAENAINGALMMRTALRKFNQNRGGDRKPIIKIGCGLNSGDVLAGQIGSNERMEYTVIGDAVNLASRIEALNKPMGTDILISQGTADMVEGIFDIVPMNKIKVKGKSEPQQIYAVLGRLDDPDRPKSLKELRDRVGITGDFDNIAEVNTEKEEVKYEIMD